MNARLPRPQLDPLPAEATPEAALAGVARAARRRWRARWEPALLAAEEELGADAVASALSSLAGLLEAGVPAAGLPWEDVELCWRGRDHWLIPAGGGAALVPRQPRDQLEQALQDWIQRELLPAALAAEAPCEPVLRAAQRLGPLLLEPWRELAELRGQLWSLPAVRATSYRFALESLPEALRAELGPATDEGVLDTERLDPAQRDRALAGLADRDAACDGVLLLGDNAQALALLGPRFQGQVQCAYLDPPYNTGNGGFAYRDRRGRAAWLTCMDERLARTCPLLRSDGTLYAQIDYHEKERLRLLLDRHLVYVTEIIWRIGWLSGFKTRAKKFIRNHDTIYQYGACPRPLFFKRYLPYPEGYLRRDGKPPRGEGYPLEDTWNCSPLDRLDSILIKSFSREKVGAGDLTQKNEALLERILAASSRPGDWVLDPFAGSGTSAAVAHKTGRRWLTVEAEAEPGRVALERLERVLSGDRYGVSQQVGWSGGGGFSVVRLVRYPELLAALAADEQDPDALHLRWDGARLRCEPLEPPDPFACRLAGGDVPLDLPEWAVWTLGLTVRRTEQRSGCRVLAGHDPAGARVLLVYRRLAEADAEGLLEVLTRYLTGIEAEGGRIFVHGAPGRDAAAARWPAWRLASTAEILELALTPHAWRAPTR